MPLDTAPEECTGRNLELLTMEPPTILSSFVRGHGVPRELNSCLEPMAMELLIP